MTAEKKRCGKKVGGKSRQDKEMQERVELLILE